MDNNVLNSLLREYDQKRIRAELDLEKRKESISFALSHNFLEIGLVSIKGVNLLYALEVHLSQTL